MTTVPDFTIIIDWLKKLNVEYYQCDSCPSLHLAYLQKMDGVSDAKIEVIDDAITISLVTEVRLDAILALVGEMSQINMSLNFAKVYLDLTDNDVPKIKFSYCFYVSDELTFNQFCFSLSRLEEEALQVIGELEHCGFLIDKNHIINDTEFSSLKTYH